jgi:hypothetical protein
MKYMHNVARVLESGPGCDVERVLAALATRQGGALGHDQLGALGCSRGAIAWRLKRGRMHTVFRGVYALGHEALTRSAASSRPSSPPALAPS